MFTAKVFHELQPIVGPPLGDVAPFCCEAAFNAKAVAMTAKNTFFIMDAKILSFFEIQKKK
jgi:hypothetical protein